MNKPTLNVSSLRTEFVSRAGKAVVVDDVSLSVNRGEILALVGESGSGKSMTGYSIMGLIDAPGKVVAGTVELAGANGNVMDIRRLTPRARRAIRGNRIAMIFQDPMMTLNPVLRIDTQMIEAVLAHQDVNRATARDIARQALVRVGIPSPDERLKAYPHQFSGGMRQRVAIAIALLNAPDLIIADEPTTALDVTIQGQILFEMQKICRDAGTALIWITHDLSVVAGFADKVSVMYAGKIIEHGLVDDMIHRPTHPYTAALIRSTPAANKRGEPFRQLSGVAPSLLKLPPGCAFSPRCEHRMPACQSGPIDMRDYAGRSVRCIHPAVTSIEH
jgi:peptide/nickel transport system ATP-binding protein